MTTSKQATRSSGSGSITVRLVARVEPDLAAAALGPWAARALCADTDPELFFPPPGDPGTAARAICARCPVRQDCLAYALAADEKFGIWGGLDPGQRASMRRRQRRASRTGTTGPDAA